MSFKFSFKYMYNEALKYIYTLPKEIQNNLSLRNKKKISKS